MELKVNIKKEHLIVLIALLGVAFAVAYGTNNPRELGHSAGEIDIMIGNQTTTLQEAIASGRVGGANLRQESCSWAGGNQRCESCEKIWTCPNGTYAAGIKHRSTGENHIDYVGVYCCRA